MFIWTDHFLNRQQTLKVVGAVNKAASGTEIIEELGEEEINEGKMIVYTSAEDRKSVV